MASPYFISYYSHCDTQATSERGQSRRFKPHSCHGSFLQTADAQASNAEIRSLRSPARTRIVKGIDNTAAEKVPSSGAGLARPDAAKCLPRRR